MQTRTNHQPAKFTVPYRDKYKPINGYGIIGDTRTAALIGFDGSIDWSCLPRFDSPSVFAALLDHRQGGHWNISPVSKSIATQRYITNTNILTTEFHWNHSSAILTDFMPISSSPDFASSPPELHRIIECTKGHAPFRIDFQPRFNYAQSIPEFQIHSEGVSVTGERNQLTLSSTLSFPTTGRSSISKMFELNRGEKHVFVLKYGESKPKKIESYQTQEKLAGTTSYWTNWVSKLKCGPRWKPMITRSALALKLLCYSPTGAIVAAPTTSLPEAIGAERNWDYRFSWVRDTALSLWAFHLLGDGSPSEKYHRWLSQNNLGLISKLKLMHQVDGKSSITERVLPHLEGYKGSGPVRIGNAANRQFQIDAYGYMLDGLYYSSKHGTQISEDTYRRFVKLLANYICENWNKPGHGIWEVRERREHYVYTKAWCIAGLQRAVKIARALGHDEDIPYWKSTMRNIRKEMMTKGWNPSKKAFRRTYESNDVDSATLMIPLMGILSAKHPKMVHTVEAVSNELSRGPLLYRYRTNDGFDGNEGAFLLCSFWHVACLARMGRTIEAKRIFEQLLHYANHLGLYSEEIDPDTGSFLGNFPQAFSHMGLIMAAHELNKHH